MENKFIKGVIFGGLLVSAAATVGFAMSKEGRECAKKMKENIKPMVKKSLESLSKFPEMVKDDFDELVTTLVDDYAKKKELNNDSKNKMAKVLKSKWDEIKVKFESESSI